MYVHICSKNQKQRIMKHRQFKTECLCIVVIKEKTFTCKDIREVKKKIYHLGTREEKYRVDVIDKNTGMINDIYLMKYTKEGPIFSKQIYSRWKEELAKAKTQQLAITTTLFIRQKISSYLSKKSTLTILAPSKLTTAHALFSSIEDITDRNLSFLS